MGVLGLAVKAAKKVAKAAEPLPRAQREAAAAQFAAKSAVRNPDGTPRRVYTGTSKDTDFDAFKVGKRGAWFTSDPEDASMYATANDSQKLVRDDRPGAAPWSYRRVNDAPRVIPAFLDLQNPKRYTGAEMMEATYALGGENYARGEGLLFDQLRAQGHDGVMLDDHTFVALNNPGQIKSIFNQGAFDPKNPKMNKARGGIVSSLVVKKRGKC